MTNAFSEAGVATLNGDAESNVRPAPRRRKGHSVSNITDFDLEHDTRVVAALLAVGDITIPNRVIARFLRNVGGCVRLLTATSADYLPLARTNPDAAILLRTVSELLRRCLAPRAESRPIIANWKALLDFLRIEIANRTEERAIVLFFNPRNTLVKKRVFYGTVSKCHFSIRDIVKDALDVGAVSIVIAHNHPSGSKEPSRDDIIVSQSLKESLYHFDISLQDSLIITSEGIFSMKAEGLLID